MTQPPEAYHIPVLLTQSVDGLQINPAGVYVDVTFGGGGHSREILRRLGPDGRLFGFDQDSDSESNIPDDNRFTFVRSNFRYLANWMRYYGIDQIDGLLADLGVSSHHFDDESRGFSFRFDSPLDMRMNKQSRLTAADVVNGYEERQLADILYLYGELKNARRLAAAIVKARSQSPISTTQELASLMGRLMPREREKKEVTKVFQALRIEVNHEMEALKEMLQAATSLLAPEGRLVVITYHSLEDRIVKNMMKSGNAGGMIEQDFYGRVNTPLRPLSNKVITPSDEEMASNPRSRSAKLRIAEKR
jgi:16S rRNA (cytosine1402-N4)-methyltransferase